MFQSNRFLLCGDCKTKCRKRQKNQITANKQTSLDRREVLFWNRFIRLENKSGEFQEYMLTMKNSGYAIKKRSNHANYWQLSRITFLGLLKRISENQEIAGKAYLQLQKNLIRFFESKCISMPEDAADETLNRLARKISNGEAIENINRYAIGIARLVALEYFRKPHFIEFTKDFEKRLPVSLEVEIMDYQLELNRLEKCLNSLPEKHRYLLLEYYEGDGAAKIENRKRIANTFGIQQNALCKRVVRLREKLEKMMSAETGN